MVRFCKKEIGCNYRNKTNERIYTSDVIYLTVQIEMLFDFSSVKT